MIADGKLSIVASLLFGHYKNWQLWRREQALCATYHSALFVKKPGTRVNLTVSDLSFEALVFFAADEWFNRNVLGRVGFLDRVLLGLNDYAGELYLSRND